MNYPVTDDYLAERLRRAVEELPRGSVIAQDIRALACFFEFRDAYARLDARGQEDIASIAREMVLSDERRRIERETRKRMEADEPISRRQCRRSEPDDRTLGERLKGSE